jgi:hypothetical protein
MTCLPKPCHPADQYAIPRQLNTQINQLESLQFLPIVTSRLLKLGLDISSVCNIKCIFCLAEKVSSYVNQYGVVQISYCVSSAMDEAATICDNWLFDWCKFFSSIGLHGLICQSMKSNAGEYVCAYTFGKGLFDV